MIGEELGSYRILEPIGKGGMASVFVAEHTVLGSRVAIKILQHGTSEHPMLERRFINEAKAIAAIRHPGVIELFDFGRGPDGRAYIVMELLHGETLRSRMRRGVLTPNDTVVFSRQIAEAVATVHDAGIVHRDLKPDNIFLVPDPEVELGERVKVLDFGVAKDMTLQNQPASEVTATGVLVGTPAYMSPEQCKGTGEIDHRTDIYSLGIVMFRMLTGQLPFESAGTGELIGKHIYEIAPEVQELDNSVPVELSALIASCLAKNKEDRPQSMHAVAQELRRIRVEVLGGRYETGPSVDRVMRAPVLSPGQPAGKGAVSEEDEKTNPTTLRSATGEAAKVPSSGSRWTLPLFMGSAVGIGVFLALFIGGSGDRLVPSDPTAPAPAKVPAAADAGVAADPIVPDAAAAVAATLDASVAADASVVAAKTPDAAAALANTTRDGGAASVSASADAGTAAAATRSRPNRARTVTRPKTRERTSARKRPESKPDTGKREQGSAKTPENKSEPKNPKAIKVPILQ